LDARALVVIKVQRENRDQKGRVALVAPKVLLDILDHVEILENLVKRDQEALQE